MNYILVQKKQLDDKGLFPYAETLPDGRAILPLNALKAVTGLMGVDIVDGITVKALRETSYDDTVLQTSEENNIDIQSEVENIAGKEVVDE